MIPISAIDINYQIISFDNKNIVIKPFSNLFVNPISSYPAFNYDLSTFDLTNDLPLQIGTRIQNYIFNTVNREQLTISDSLSSILINSINQIVTVPQSILPTNPLITSTTTTPSLPVGNNNVNFVV